MREGKYTQALLVISIERLYSSIYCEKNTIFIGSFLVARSYLESL